MRLELLHGQGTVKHCISDLHRFNVGRRFFAHGITEPQLRLQFAVGVPSYVGEYELTVHPLAGHCVRADVLAPEQQRTRLAARQSTRG
jgi:hypothetical protein